MKADEVPVLSANICQVAHKMAIKNAPMKSRKSTVFSDWRSDAVRTMMSETNKYKMVKKAAVRVPLSKFGLHSTVNHMYRVRTVSINQLGDRDSKETLGIIVGMFSNNPKSR